MRFKIDTKMSYEDYRQQNKIDILSFIDLLNDNEKDEENENANENE